MLEFHLKPKCQVVHKLSLSTSDEMNWVPLDRCHVTADQLSLFLRYLLVTSQNTFCYTEQN